MFTLATMEPSSGSGCRSGANPRMPALQVFGMRPCPRAVVAGAGAGVGRVPPSTLYTRVLALKVAPVLTVEVAWVEHQVRRDVADHLDIHLALGEVPAVWTVGGTAEAIEIPADDDWLQRHRLGVLDNAERGARGGRSLSADLDDRIENQVAGARGVAVLGVAAGGHREQLGQRLGARRRRGPGARKGGPGQQLPDPVEVARVD